MSKQSDNIDEWPEDWLDSLPERMVDQFRFLIEAEQLRAVIRQSPALRGMRRENAAEHSWHLALFASVLAEWANEPIEVGRVITMLVIHDLVEVDAGDVSIFDEHARFEQSKLETCAADRIFGLLPTNECAEFRNLWQEFEDGSTAEARFARAVDRLQPILLNHLARGGTWTEHSVDVDRERRLTGHIADGSQALWSSAEAIFREAIAGGWMRGGTLQQSEEKR